MKTKTVLALLLLGLLLPLALRAKEGSDLLLRLKMGDTYQTTNTLTGDIIQEFMGQRIEVEQLLVVNSTIEVSGVDDNGNFALSYRYTGFRIDIKGLGQNYSFGTATPDPQNPLSAVFGNIIEQPLQLTVSPTGKILKTAGFEALSSKTEALPQISEVIKLFVDPKYFSAYFEHSFNYLTREDINAQESWENRLTVPVLGDATIDIRYRTIKQRGDQLTLGVSSKINTTGRIRQNGIEIGMKIDGNQSGTLQVNTDDGMPRNTDMLLRLQMVLTFKNPLSADDLQMPMEMNISSRSVTKKQR